MKRLACGTFALVFCAPAFAAPSDNTDWLDMSAGESRTVYVTGPENAAAPPVFRICFRSTAGYNGALRVTAADKGPAAGHVEPMAPGDCLFASGQKLVVSVDASLPPEKVAERQAAAETAKSWMQERVEALRALPEPTERDRVLLAEFENGLKAPGEPTATMNSLQRLQYQQRVEELEARPDLTKEENAELTLLKYKAALRTDERNGFRVTLQPR